MDVSNIDLYGAQLNIKDSVARNQSANALNVANNAVVKNTNPQIFYCDLELVKSDTLTNCQDIIYCSSTNHYVQVRDNSEVLQFIEYDTEFNKLRVVDTTVVSHGNSMVYFNGEIFVTGGNSYNRVDVFSSNLVFKRSIDLTTQRGAWCFTPFIQNNKTNVLIVEPDNKIFKIYSTIPNENKYLNLFYSTFDFVTGVPQTAITDGSYIFYSVSHSITPSISANSVQIFNYDGTRAWTILFNNYQNVEIEGIFILGNYIYLNDWTGNIYRFKYTDYVYSYWQKGINIYNPTGVINLYISNNGSESYRNVNSITVLDSFKLQTNTKLNQIAYAIPILQFAGQIYMGVMHPISLDIQFHFEFVRLSYRYYVNFTYTIDSSDADNYIYNLSDASGYYQNLSGGAITYLNTIDTVLSNCIFNNLYIYGIFGFAGMKYEFAGFELT